MLVRREMGPNFCFSRAPQSGVSKRRPLLSDIGLRTDGEIARLRVFLAELK
jgi:hypothetical protein